jgi:exopolysaccharide biosynthesis polyprenyl glycosylphosphotransferase
MRSQIKKLILVFGDLLLLYISLFAVLALRYGQAIDVQKISKHVIPFTFIYLIWIVVFYIWDLYNISVSLNYKNFLKAMVMNGIVAIVIFYTVPYLQITPKTSLVLNVLIFSALFIAWRVVFARIFHFRSYVDAFAVVGVNAHSLYLIEAEKENRGYYVAALLTEDAASLPKWVFDSKMDIRTSIEKIDDVIEQKKIKKVVVSSSIYLKKIHQFYPHISKGVSFYTLPVFWEEYYQRIPIFETNELWIVENFRNTEKLLYEKIKRILDVALCILALPIYFLLFPLIAAIIRLDSKGPVLYTQVRSGRQGRKIVITKFRTMTSDAERHGVRWASENDPRVTKVGRILRKTRLDEFPQVFCILRGDLSFIGPRPERPEFTALLARKIPHYNLRHMVKPGMTGWAQINYPYGASEEDAAKKLEYDLYYVKNRSFVLDLKIALKTIMIILSGMGR